MKSNSSSTFVTFAICMSFSSSSIAEEKAHRLICYDSPAKNTWANASPATFDQAIRGRKFHHEVDGHGQGILWGLAHWVEIDDPPIATDEVSIGREIKFDAKAHLVVFREFWTYGQDGRKEEWVRRTVCHLTAEKPASSDSALWVSAEQVASGGYRIREFDAAAHSNVSGAQPVRWNGKVIGWVTVAWTAKDGQLRTDFRWHDSEANSSYISDTRNALKLKRPPRTSNRGGLYLNWEFVTSDSEVGKSRGYDPAQEKRNFVLPPTDAKTK